MYNYAQKRLAFAHLQWTIRVSQLLRCLRIIIPKSSDAEIMVDSMKRCWEVKRCRWKDVDWWFLYDFLSLSSLSSLSLFLSFSLSSLFSLKKTDNSKVDCKFQSYLYFFIISSSYASMWIIYLLTIEEIFIFTYKLYKMNAILFAMKKEKSVEMLTCWVRHEANTVIPLSRHFNAKSKPNPSILSYFNVFIRIFVTV